MEVKWFLGIKVALHRKITYIKTCSEYKNEYKVCDK